MIDDAEIARVARKEAAERIDRIIVALRETPTPEWSTVYREAHTIAGFGEELDPSIATEARQLASRLGDGRGGVIEPDAAAARAARRDAERLSAGFERLYK